MYPNKVRRVSGEPVEVGDQVTDFRGATATLRGVTGLPTVGKVGYVRVEWDHGGIGEYYPNVFDLVIAEVSDERAREIASWWHSPSVHDDQITRLSHGLPVTDWARLDEQVRRNLGSPMRGGERAPLVELLKWIADNTPV